MFGLVVIILSVLIAIFAYFISPDSSPYANRIILEVARQKPGTHQMFLKLRKERNVTDAGFFEQLLWGKEDKYYYVPITGFQKSGASQQILQPESLPPRHKVQCCSIMASVHWQQIREASGCTQPSEIPPLQRGGCMHTS